MLVDAAAHVEQPTIERRRYAAKITRVLADMGGLSVSDTWRQAHPKDRYGSMGG
jgi:hypothetical protein